MASMKKRNLIDKALNDKENQRTYILKLEIDFSNYVTVAIRKDTTVYDTIHKVIIRRNILKSTKVILYNGGKPLKNNTNLYKIMELDPLGDNIHIILIEDAGTYEHRKAINELLGKKDNKPLIKKKKIKNQKFLNDRMAKYKQRSNSRRGTITKLKKEINKHNNEKMKKLETIKLLKQKQKQKQKQKPKTHVHVPKTVVSSVSINDNKNNDDDDDHGKILHSSHIKANINPINPIDPINKLNQAFINQNISSNSFIIHGDDDNEGTETKINNAYDNDNDVVNDIKSKTNNDFFGEKDDNAAVNNVNDKNMKSDADIWYNYLINFHFSLMNTITYWDLIEFDIPFISDKHNIDKYIISRTLLSQMKYWIERYGIPAMNKYHEIYQLKKELISINYEAEQFEDEVILLTQKLYNLENNFNDINNKYKQKINEYNILKNKYNKLLNNKNNININTPHLYQSTSLNLPKISKHNKNSQTLNSDYFNQKLVKINKNINEEKFQNNDDNDISIIPDLNPNEVLWNGYINEYGVEPSDPNKLLKYSQIQNHINASLNFKSAKIFFFNNKGKGKIGKINNNNSKIDKQPLNKKLINNTSNKLNRNDKKLIKTTGRIQELKKKMNLEQNKSNNYSNKNNVSAIKHKKSKSNKLVVTL